MNSDSRKALFGADSMPFLTVPLRAFTPPFPAFVDFSSMHAQSRNVFLSSDVECLEEACGLVESLTMDIEEVRLSLAQEMTSVTNDHSIKSCLSCMLDFVELGEYLPNWNAEDPADVIRWKKAIDLCKAAVIKAIVETAGEEQNLSILWDVNNKSGFVSRMVNWVRDQTCAPLEIRDDLVICGSLSLGNLVRKGKNDLHFVIVRLILIIV